MSLKPTVTHEGQRYVDDAVYAMPKPIQTIEAAVARAFDRRLPRPIHIGYERVKLRWMKPDGKGGLVPKLPR